MERETGFLLGVLSTLLETAKSGSSTVELEPQNSAEELVPGIGALLDAQDGKILLARWSPVWQAKREFACQLADRLET